MKISSDYVARKANESVFPPAEWQSPSQSAAIRLLIGKGVPAHLAAHIAPLAGIGGAQ